MRVAMPILDQKDGLRVAPHFGKARRFYILDLESGKSSVVEIPEAEKGRGRMIAEILREKGVSVVVCRNIGEGALERLKEAGIEVRKTDKSNPDDAVEDLRV
ncbi:MULTISPECIES: NifB/NifX family molybdenum-iron cluster-binding protein [Archaeoglobus]|jgi:predicted Fe-Mo cluster-binding NifX family protein|uniref:Dinitrogenase iron-molybdenum cofactor biosynthesis domain-containing protein n=3 Tax=Archaeoglobus fulgidus TaxID=2234 RepID=O29589_ARCFU|nr:MULTISPECIES: NifB/NifX family molybdenum-iron cluster-binding protein [Archaeoglobus]AAB90572.1 conserved hypothetical protein [Archaeoglobus fulgidus DSM 4304]AIG97546.1 hypothetical protein AFULGI_00007480 [Archaeoglobus fulgidus DSM 8774]KUJ94255.1 MAG: hypothetical protein XD40_0499 [Archaeoglobus fulgidus]KUK07530.1 MAG: hypothetical protein XD48_0184 [Archaeoglobus fulgidus]MDI3498556.1 hypothetical protein [Archaeoglobus sp.]